MTRLNQNDDTHARTRGRLIDRSINELSHCLQNGHRNLGQELDCHNHCCRITNIKGYDLIHLIKLKVASFDTEWNMLR